VGRRVITFKIDEELLQALDTYCLKHGLPRSIAIRLAIIKLLNESGYNRNSINIKRVSVR